MAPRTLVPRRGPLGAHRKARFIGRLAAIFVGGAAVYLGSILLALRLLGIET
jgi:hypothetical protein